ncbi:MAG: mandelate racemase/muconate lactonizing enzyme family protein [Legionellales bacterium]|jgi:L-alanine-DL-glutamate epimerase-like enolase superfamily enzyme
MKITQVEIFDIECPKRPKWHPVFVRIHTDEGISGVGEAGLAYDWGHSAAAHMIKEISAAILIGWDPFKTELLWTRMLRESFWGLGGGPVIYAAMSAIDTALWDIKGKALNVPVYQLLGGKTLPRLRTYASQLQFDWDSTVNPLNHPSDYAKAAEKAIKEGYDCVKVNPMFYDETGQTQYDLTKIFKQSELRLYHARLQAIRDAVGPDVDIIIECHSLLSPTTAIQFAEAAQDLNCMFYEEPVNYLNPALHQQVANKIRIPTAAGERLYTRNGVRPYLETQSVAVLQPDIGLCGGFTEAKKICDYADLYNVTIQAHVCGGPVATMAALHLETAIPNFLIHEHHTYAIKDWNRELCLPDLQPIQGYFEVPDTPGLGIELNDTIVKRSPMMTIK